MAQINQIILIVLDSVGIGNAPDAELFGDEGSNTLGNIAQAVGGLRLPNMAELGLGWLGDFVGIPRVINPSGAFGRLTERSAGKDTTIGHWELAGVSSPRPFPTFPDGFPGSFITEFERRVGRKTIGNYPASGTEIIRELGEQHIKTGDLIVYTSADSVFQIAAHEEIVNLNELYQICRIARELLQGELDVARVIARPFVGLPGVFRRTENRRDFSRLPPRDTLLDLMKSAGKMVAGVGKIEDIFAHRGLTDSDHTGNNLASIEGIIRFIETCRSGLIFANLVDFDALYGHRNNPQGYADALEEFDQNLPQIIGTMTEQDILMITADHGNDPTTPSTDHSRERVPLLISGSAIRHGANIGTRETFTDVAATIADIFDIQGLTEGVSFASTILRV